MKKDLRILVLVMAAIVVFLCSCTQKSSYTLKKEKYNRSFHGDDSIYNSKQATHIDHGTLKDSGDMRTWLYATSETTQTQNQNDLNFVVSDPYEPVYLSIHQTGKNRKLRLLVYVDYISQEFMIGESKSSQNHYDFEIKNNEEIILPIHIVYSNIDPDISHRLFFILIPGFDQHAKDKEDITINPVVSMMYQLYFNEYRENMICKGIEEIPQAEKMVCCEGSGFNILLNTDFAKKEPAAKNGIILPEKHYTISDGETMKMNCRVSNISPPEKYALVFLTVGNLPALIDGKAYIIIDINNIQIGEKEVKLTPPVGSGVFDTIGYIVYNPFEPIIIGESSDVYSSPRFSIEVLGNDFAS